VLQGGQRYFLWVNIPFFITLVIIRSYQFAGSPSAFRFRLQFSSSFPSFLRVIKKCFPIP
jgi:hypothetical protein